MAVITSPRLEPDGSHIIPVTGIHRPGCEPNEDSKGEIRWSRRDGATFLFQAPLTSLSVFEPNRCGPRGGAGSVSSVSFNPEWLARTEDGSEVRLYATDARTTTGITTHWDVVSGGSSESSKRVTGTANYIEVSLHKDSPLAYFYETPRAHRLFSPGWTLRKLPIEEPNEYRIGDSTDTGSRHFLPLAGSCGRSLFATWQATGKCGMWLTYDPDAGAEPFWFPESCDRVRGLMSILLGRHVPFVWRDTPVSEDRLTRLYYGWHKGNDPDHPTSQLVPVYGAVESLTHGQQVTIRLPTLDERFADLRKLFDPEWVASSLWSAEADYVDNKLALACVALERLSAAYQDFIRPTRQYPTPAPLMTHNQRETLRARLQATLSEVMTSEGLTADAARIVGKRINDLSRPTNNDRLVMVFEELGIPLGEVEREAISNRNRSLHGHRTLRDGHDTDQCGAELLRYDILRTLIGRAFLHLLGYDGHYIDYSARPETGNFPLRLCTPTIVNNPLALPIAENDWPNVVNGESSGGHDFDPSDYGCVRGERRLGMEFVAFDNDRDPLAQSPAKSGLRFRPAMATS